MSKYFDCLEQAMTKSEVSVCDDLIEQEDEFDEDTWDEEDEYDRDEREDSGYDPMWDDDETWRQ